MLILPYLPCKFAQPAVVTNKNNLLRGIFLTNPQAAQTASGYGVNFVL